MRLADVLKRQALGAVQRTAAWVLADERRARQVARTVGGLQRARQGVERSQEELLRALHLATRGDLQEVGRKLSGMKRRLRALEAKLESLQRNKR